MKRCYHYGTDDSLDVSPRSPIRLEDCFVRYTVETDKMITSYFQVKKGKGNPKRVSLEQGQRGNTNKKTRHGTASTQQKFKVRKGLIAGDPSVKHVPVFPKDDRFAYRYKFFKYTFTLDANKKDDQGYVMGVQIDSHVSDALGRTRSFGMSGDYGRKHRYLINGKLIESDIVWFRRPSERLDEPKDVVAVEQPILSEDDEKVHFLSFLSGKIIDRKTREEEILVYHETMSREEKLFELVKNWDPATCDESIVAFRKAYAHNNFTRNCCYCGVVRAERRNRNTGESFYGCSLFPHGCRYSQH